MPRILTFTRAPEDWRHHLGDPNRHWKTGFSARTLAHCWEAADGFPAEIAKLANGTTEPLLAGLTPLIAVPEFKVPLPGGRRASQNDIFVLACSNLGAVSIMVEGKVDEPFGPTVDEWRSDASPGKEKRLAFLVETLGLGGRLRNRTRYQFLHRAVSAILTGEQFHAVAAIMLIHSFSRERTGWWDYSDFLEMCGAEARPDEIQRLGTAASVPLFSAWVSGDHGFLER
jgi:hypothetical protein